MLTKNSFKVRLYSLISTFKFVLAFYSTNSIAADPLDFAVTVTSPNNTPEAVVDVVLDTICPEIIASNESENSNLQNVCNFIVDASADEIAKVTEELSAKSNTASNTLISKTPTMTPTSGIGLRLAALRSSARKTNQYAYHKKNKKRSSSPLNTVFNEQESEEQGSLLSQRLSAFLNVNNIAAEQLESSTEIGYESASRGLLFGIDYRLLKSTFIGIASQYYTTSADLSDSGSKLNANQIGITVYGTHFINKRWYLETTYSTSQQQLDIERQIDLDLGLNTVAKSNTNSRQLGVYFGTGYDIPLKFGFNSVASVGVSYVSNTISAYTESNTGGLGLAIDSQSITSLTTISNLHLSKAFSTSLGIIIPQLSGTWVHETKQEELIIGSRFANDSSNTRFEFESPAADANYFVLGVDLQMVLPKGRMIFMKYSNVARLRDKIEHSLAAGFRMEF